MYGDLGVGGACIKEQSLFFVSLLSLYKLANFHGDAMSKQEIDISRLQY